MPTYVDYGGWVISTIAGWILVTADRDDEESYPYEYMRIGRHLANRLGPNVTLVAGATALRIKPVESGRAVRSVEFAAPDGHRRILSAWSVVVCCGAIENARILLSSDTGTPN